MEGVNILLMSASAVLLVGGLVFIVLWPIMALIKSLRRDAWDMRNANQNVPPMFEKLLEKAMAERDAEQALMKERIATLERIVVDNHGRVDLSGAIDQLGK